MGRHYPDRGNQGVGATNVRNPEIRVLIADDHTVVRDGLAAMIGRWTDVAVVA